MEQGKPSHLAAAVVVEHAPLPHALPYYTVAGDGLEMGASFGNSTIWVDTKGTGAVERVFANAIGQSLCNSISIRYAAPGHRPAESSVRPHHDLNVPSYVSLRPAVPGNCDIHPAYQRHRFSLAGTLDVAETTFVPLTGDATGQGDQPVLYQVVELRNRGPLTSTLRIIGYARLRGTLSADVRAYYDKSSHAIVACNTSRTSAVRVFGVTEVPSAYATTFDYGSVYDPLHVHPLDNSTEATGDILGCVQVDLSLAPGEARRFAFMMAVSCDGEADAIKSFRASGDFDRALTATISYLTDVLARSEVLTPDPLINQGAKWSKVNMLRVMARYPQGPAFTNEPGVSSNVVGRDMAWFVYGNDHFLPEFSRSLLDTFARAQYSNGKIPEYYNALDGRVEDYGLNINDDTPLFILAVNHHFRATGDIAWLRGIYSAVCRAASYIIAQQDDRGLVFCSAKDPRGNVWAIAGWRNVIPDYSLNGAVTEINAECIAALRAAGHLSQNLAQMANVSSCEADAVEYFGASQKLRTAMHAHLLNPENGLYYLNIDADGNVHTDVTGDQIFPVMFRVCDDDVGFRIISRLNSPDFWTLGGLRTASQDDPMYDPLRFVGLVGGVWPGLTWWYAFAAARYHPDFMVDALRSSFEHYAANPKTNNTVPGQFSEWFDGESLVNRGMRLSPWEPPRFLWAAVEGVCGLMLSPGRPRIQPVVPDRWKWVALRRLTYHGGEITYFAARHGARFHIYASADVEAMHGSDRYDEDVSDRVHASSASAQLVALRRDREVMVLVGIVGSQTGVVPLNLTDVLDQSATYTVRIYDSERGEWEPARVIPGGVCGSMAVSIEAFGYRAIELIRNDA